jgi:hypothetical protein
MEEHCDQFTTNIGQSNSCLRFHAADRPFSFLMVPEDSGSRFLKTILHQFPQEHCLKMITVSMSRNNKTIIWLKGGVQWNKGEWAGGLTGFSWEKIPSTKINWEWQYAHNKCAVFIALMWWWWLLWLWWSSWQWWCHFCCYCFAALWHCVVR